MIMSVCSMTSLLLLDLLLFSMSCTKPLQLPLFFQNTPPFTLQHMIYLLHTNGLFEPSPLEDSNFAPLDVRSIGDEIKNSLGRALNFTHPFVMKSTKTTAHDGSVEKSNGGGISEFVKMNVNMQ